jgi:hypothetical protein
MEALVELARACQMATSVGSVPRQVATFFSLAHRDGQVYKVRLLYMLR